MMATGIKCPVCISETAACYFVGYIKVVGTPISRRRFKLICDNPTCQYTESVDVAKTEVYWTDQHYNCPWCGKPASNHLKIKGDL